MSSVLRTLLLFCLLPPCGLTAQMGDGCTGDTFLHVVRDEAGEDVRVSALIRYTGASGDLLLGGTVGGDLFFSRISATGELRWRRRISRPSQSTELSTLSEMLIDREGKIAAVGSVFNDPNRQQAFLLRYDPLADRVLYLRIADFPSQATGIKLGRDDGYLVSGSRFGSPAPVFNSGLLMRVDPQTGLETSPSQRFDHLGDEGFIDLLPRPDGSFYTGGNISANGRSRDARASITRHAADGTPLWTRSGPAPESVSARLLTFDVEVVNDIVYVLHWGNIGNITGSINTSMLLAAFSLNGEALWTRRYDVLDYEGEEAVELLPYRGGLLALGFRLIGKRDPFLLQLTATGEVAWAREYEMPGSTTIYLRANQQLLADDFGIGILSSYRFNGERPREGVLLQLDPVGLTDNQCVAVRDLNVIRTEVAASWEAIPFQLAEASADWPTVASTTLPSSIGVFDDCDVSCEDCSVRTFSRAAICRGDSLLIGGRWRRQAGVYADTLPGPLPGCDSIRQLELAVSDGPVASFRSSRQCGLRTTRVLLDVTGGEFPYVYQWSAPGVTGGQVDLLPGNYRVTVNDALGCFPFVLDVAVEDAGNGGIDYALVPPTCPGGRDGRIIVTPPGAGSLKLLPDGPFRANLADSLSAGNYQFILRDTTGCEVFRQVSIPDAEPLAVNVSGPAFVRLGDEVSLVAQSLTSANFARYNWRSRDSLVCADCPIARARPVGDQTIYLTAETAEGCPAEDSLLVRVSDTRPRLYLPTAFSPNADGLNDLWEPGLGAEISRVLQWEVFDRWGRMVFDYRPETGWWDGTNEAPGVYTFRLRAELINGRTIERSGAVTLVR